MKLETTKCPNCAAQVARGNDGFVCSYCNTHFNTEIEPKVETKTESHKCPSCLKEVDITERYCPHCKEILNRNKKQKVSKFGLFVLIILIAAYILLCV